MTRFIWHWRVLISWPYQWVLGSETIRIHAHVSTHSRLPLRHAPVPAPGLVLPSSPRHRAQRPPEEPTTEVVASPPIPVRPPEELNNEVVDRRSFLIALEKWQVCRSVGFGTPQTRKQIITLTVPLSGAERGKRPMYAPKPGDMVPCHPVNTNTVTVWSVVKATTRRQIVSTRKQLNVIIAICLDIRINCVNIITEGSAKVAVVNFVTLKQELWYFQLYI